MARSRRNLSEPRSSVHRDRRQRMGHALYVGFYIFYMLIAAVTGAFAMGMRAFSAQSFVRQFMVIILMGLALTYMGITRYAGAQIESFGNLKTVQRSRLDASQSAQSGFAQDV